MEISAKPLIYINNEATKAVSNPSNLKDFFKKNFSKIVFITLGLIIAVETVYAAQTLFLNPDARPPKIYPMGEGKMILSTPKTSYGLNEPIFVTVKISTGGRNTTGTDLVLKYDPTVLETADNKIKTGSIYSDYPVAAVDPSGQVIISGIAPSTGDGFSGIGEFAVIEFKAKKEGRANLDIDFQKGETKDSNIVAIGDTKEILGEVNNLELNLGDVSTEANKPEVKSCEGFVQFCQNGEGKTGRQFCKMGVLKDNECAFDKDVSVSCDTCKVSQ